MTVAGVVAEVVVVLAGAWATLFAGEVAGLVFWVTAFDAAGPVAGLCSVFAREVAGPVAGLCSVFAVAVSGAVAGLEAGSGGSGARVSDGRAFETTGVSTLGELVVTGAGGFSVLAVAVVASVLEICGGAFCGAVSAGCLADLFKASAGAGMGLGSIEGVDSTLATSLDGATGAAATF